jgi:Lamin Tail Domain/CotH kinase protein
MRFLPLLLLICCLHPVAAADSTVVFNEVQYHPALGETEWIELRNLNGVDVNTAGWTITGGIDFTFPATGAGSVIPGGGYLLIAAVPTQLPGSIGPFTGVLSNGGETLRIRNLNGRIMDEISYDDEGNWPAGADGSRATLTRRNETKASTGAAAWVASSQLGGTPGGRNFPATAPTTRFHILTRDSWKYRDADAAPAADWKTTAFADSTWASGNAALGAGNPATGLTVTANLAARYRAGALTGLANGATVTTWTDTALGDGVSQNGSAGSSTPTYRASATPNGKPAVRFDGNDESRTTLSPGITATGGFAYFIVLKGNSTQSSDAYIFDRALTGGGNPLASLKAQGGVFALQKRYTDGSGLGGPISTSAISSTSWQVVAVRRNRTLNRFEMWVNGALQGTESDTGAALTPDPINIGTHATNISGGFNGDIAELLIYKDGLSETDFQSVGSYLTSEYGIAVLTPLSATAPVSYLRKSFTFPGDPARTTLRLNHTVADGAVFYLNGTEILRHNMPAGPVNHSTPASSVVAPALASGQITVPSAALTTGANVLAVSLHKGPGSTATYIDAALESLELPADPAAAPALQFSEISGAGEFSFFVEFSNNSSTALNTAGWTLTTSLGQSVPLPAQSVAAGGYFSMTSGALGFTPADGTRLFLLPPGGTTLSDARVVTNRPRGLVAGGGWGHPTSPTPGAPNVAVVSTDVVINEIFYHSISGGPEQWIELYNKGTAAVDLSGWKFTGEADYTFPPATAIPAGGYLVVAWDPAAFATLHPSATALGPWSGNLSGRGGAILLRDANDNIADEVRYLDGGRWSNWADGGGSSLELRDPRSDNGHPESWAASDESAQTAWQTVSYNGPGTNPAGGDPATWNEFVFGLLNDGEFLIDDISVTTTPGTTQLIQNGNFTSGAADFWRIIGNHAGTVIDDPFAAGNKVLKISASGATEHMHNHATTTLKSGAAFHTLLATNPYTISFRAKWLRGSNRLHTRLYCNRLARQTLLTVPATGGTPGAVNRSALPNTGPVFEALSHSPVVPAITEAATVSVSAADPDGVASMQLFTSVNGAAFTSTPMTAGSGTRYSATIPAKAAGTRVQFYVRATDTPGAVSFFPAAGPGSRAMIPWQDGKAILQLPTGARPHNIRIVMPGADTNEMYKLENVMSNGSRPCTVIYDEQDIYYGATVRLKSSEHGRFNSTRVGYNLQFAADELFLGVHDAISVDRSGGTSAGQKEILIKTVTNAAGGVHAPEDDIIRIITPVATGTGAAYDGTTMTGPAILSKTRFDDTYLDGQWDQGGKGPVFKYERIYVLTETINPTTRVIDSTIVPENPKIPQDTTGPPGVNVGSLGADKENYRWYWLIENARGSDDYQKIINAATAIGQAQNSAAFKTQTNQYLDVSSVLRAHAPAILYGVTDNYLAGGAQHNVLFYFPPGGKGLIFPWDLDFLSQGATNAPLTSGQDLGKFIADPVNKRLYYGHLLDILNRSFNDAFLTRWATHYSTFGTDDMTGSLTYLRDRATYARNVINGTGGQTAAIAPAAFTRTSAATLTVSTPFATITGDGWIDINTIRLAGSPEPLAVTWTDENSWTLQLPLFVGTQIYTLEAVRPDGTTAGTVSVTVTSTSGIVPAAQDNLVISKIHYHPALPSAAEITAGYLTSEDFEYLEFQNISPNIVDLTNCRFDAGIIYSFAANTRIPVGGRLILPRRAAAFALRHPGVPTAPEYYLAADPGGNKLSDNGETLTILSAAGPDVKSFFYDDNLPWPTAADGPGSALTLISPMANSAHGDPLSWRASPTAGGAPGTASGAAFTGDPNGDTNLDGLTNLANFAIGAGSPPSLQFDRTAVTSLLAFTMDRDTAAQASSILETSTRLTNSGPGAWTPAAGATLLSRAPLTGTVERLVFAIPAAPGATRMFVRARFSSP